MIVRDPQKSKIYREQFEVSEPVGHERLEKSAIVSATEALWNLRVPYDLDPPGVLFDENEGSMYYPGSHVILLSELSSTILLHELAHAVVAAIGKTLFTESHGPLFCYEFGKLWSEFTLLDFSTWRSRWNDRGVKVASSRPTSEGEKWALSKAGIVTRPAEQAINNDIEVEKVFTSINSHPMA